MELDAWIRGRTGVVSIDADFFTREEEWKLAPRAVDWLALQIDAGVPVVFREEHVDLLESVSRPVDFVVNFDYHMDCRIEYLHGHPPKNPPCSASVFETLLSRDLVERYVWAFPAARNREAALVYASALVAGAQPVLTRIHCVNGRYALETMLPHTRAALIFVCRSPDYATAGTDAVFDRLACLIAR